MKPNLFIIGAPKCGTTSLSVWLSKHPSVFVSPIKEPHYFYSPYGAKMGIEEYENLFALASPAHRVRAEASVWYLFSESAVSQIQEYQPAAKFIVCLRNPYEMAPSLHAQKKYTGHETVSDFADAWRLSAAREQGDQVGIFGLNSGDPSHLSYRKACSLGSQYVAAVRVVGKQNILPVVLDDLRTDPRKEWRRITSFLGLDYCEPPHMEKMNPATRRRSALIHRFVIRVRNIRKRYGIRKLPAFVPSFSAWNSMRASYPRPNSALLAEMALAFEPEISILEIELGRDLTHWRLV